MIAMMKLIECLGEKRMKEFEEVRALFLDAEDSDILGLITDNMEVIYHRFLKDEWFSTFTTTACGMYLFLDLFGIKEDDKNYYMSSKLDMIVSLLILTYECLEYEDTIDLNELYTATIITESRVKYLDIHAITHEYWQDFEDYYNNMTIVFNMDEDDAKVEFYKQICPRLLNEISPGLLVVNKSYWKHHNVYGDDENALDWWSNIPQNRDKSFEEKIEYFSQSLNWSD